MKGHLYKSKFRRDTALLKKCDRLHSNHMRTRKFLSRLVSLKTLNL